jgi:hypothetical protein
MVDGGDYVKKSSSASAYTGVHLAYHRKVIPMGIYDETGKLGLYRSDPCNLQ